MAKSAGGYCGRVLGSLSVETGLPVLDGVRALSCVWVASSHAIFLWQVSAPNIFQPVYSSWWPVALPLDGDAGVDLFLLLSGYLIGHGVYGEIAEGGSFAWLRFFIRRAFRIVPVFWLAMAVALVAVGPEACEGVWRRKLLFIENFAANLQEDGLCVPQSWSVATEMQLYLLTPPVLIVATLAGKACGVPVMHVILATCACLWAACCGARCAALPAVTAQEGSVWYTGTQYRCAPYLAGVATAVLLATPRGQPAGGALSSNAGQGGAAAAVLHGGLTALAWAVILVCALYGGGGPLLGFESPLGRYPLSPRVARLHFVLGRPLFSLATSYLLWRILTGREPRLHAALAAPAWRPLARLSYSAYMMQVASFALAGRILSPLGSPSGGGAAARAVASLSEARLCLLLYVWLVLYVLLAFALALPSYALVEHSGIAVGRRLAHAAAAPLRAAAAAGRDELVRPLV